MTTRQATGGKATDMSRPGFFSLPSSAWLAWALFLAIAAAGVWLRPAFSVGETRYLTVTWNMWLSNDHIVPTLNGVAYGHKPPLLFALIAQIWDLTGPIESVARLVPPFITATSFLLIAAAAKLLWPARPAIAATAPPVLLSFAVFVFMGQTLMFDGALTFFALVSLTGMLLLVRAKTLAGILLFGTGIGLGLLTKGPVILTFALPLALLYPVWREQLPQSPSPGQWYARIGAGILLGAAIGLVWVFLAINATGADFAYEILWRQTADRVVSSFAHRKAWWFYFAVLPVIAFPWFFWPGLWNRERWRGALGEWQSRFLVTCVISVIFIMSLVSAKRFNYMLPLYPVLALMVTRLLDDIQLHKRRHFAPIAICLAGAGLAAIGLGYVTKPVPEYIADGISPWLGPAWIAVGVGYWLAQRARADAGSHNFAWTPALVLAALILVTEAGLARLFTRLDANSVVAAIPDATNVPLAVYGGDLGEFGYAARRSKPVASLPFPGDVARWVKENPGGYLLSHTTRNKDFTQSKPLRIVPYRHFEYGIWKADCLSGKLKC